MSDLGGTRKFIIDGRAYDVAEWGSCSIKMETNESVEVLTGSPGLSVRPAIPHCEVTILLKGGKASDLVGQRGVTVQRDWASGRSWIWPDAVEVGDGTVDNDGKLTLRYESATAQEL